MHSWARLVVDSTHAAFAFQGDPQRAEGAAKYMKHIAPFIGITAPDRRRLLKAHWRDLPTPSSKELGQACVKLMSLPEREFHYASYDLLETYVDSADEFFLDEYLERLLTTSSWWDTVDGFVNAGVSPLCRRFDATAIIDDWSESENRWLIRAAIGHQRGSKKETDIEDVLAICDRHWQDQEFFVAKAIGWALRDITSFDAKAVRSFLNDHPARNSVAQREAERGLQRAKPDY
jgi:3-methyladenine DNA glycosylase AlkD